MTLEEIEKEAEEAHPFLERMCSFVRKKILWRRTIYVRRKLEELENETQNKPLL